MQLNPLKCSLSLDFLQYHEDTDQKVPEWVYPEQCVYSISCIKNTHEKDIIKFLSEKAGQQIRSKIDSFQNANFLISQPNPMMLPLI